MLKEEEDGQGAGRGDGARFRAQGVHIEARKALALFRRAVELETVNLELVRRLVAFLYRAQHDPELRFDGETRGC